MKSYKREPNRGKNEVKIDVEKTKKVVREDIYDILKEAGSREEAEQEIRDFFESLDSKAIDKYTKQHGSLEIVIGRVISDIGSYGISWE